MAPGLAELVMKNKKRSAFLFTTSFSAIWLCYDYTLTNDVMKTSCRKAASYGDGKLKNFNAQPRHITVILNPIAGKRKSKKLYSKWVEPLLNLSGIKVSLIETEKPNQAYDLMKIMSNCDGVAIVGGDGTVNEALNGLLHRPDAPKAAQNLPIAIIPTGQYNCIARYIHQNLVYRNQKEFLIQSTSRLIESCYEKHDVLKIVPLDPQDRETELPKYALRDVRYGKYQDNYFKVGGYFFYQNYIKPYWIRLQRIVRYNRPQLDAIEYTEPCIGCSKCVQRHQLQSVTPSAENADKNASHGWWGILKPVSKSNSGPSAEEVRNMELSKRDNPSCDKWISVGNTADVTDLRACMIGDKNIRLSLGIGGEYTPSDVNEVQDVRIRIPAMLEEHQAASPSEDEKLEKKDEEDKTVKFLIDGQPNRARSIEITALNKVVTIYTGNTRAKPQ